MLYVQVNNFSVMWGRFPVFLTWTSMKQRIKGLVQEHDSVPPVSLVLATLWYKVKHSTTESLHSSNVDTPIIAFCFFCKKNPCLWLEGVLIVQFSYFSTKTCVVGTQKNRLIETVLLSTYNIDLNLWIRHYHNFMLESLLIWTNGIKMPWYSVCLHRQSDWKFKSHLLANGNEINILICLNSPAWNKIKPAKACFLSSKFTLKGRFRITCPSVCFQTEWVFLSNIPRTEVEIK